ncbi:shikimate dehydrogenase family protein [Algoriphagus namhaensis]
MRKFGLIGYPLGHSFSKKYFTEKFQKEGKLDCEFELYEIPEVVELRLLVQKDPGLQGLCVTIPHKEQVMALLDEIVPAARRIGAVNCIQFDEGKLIGHNTDYVGFKNSIIGWLKEERPKALVLGTGGASKAVRAALEDLGMRYLMVSRSPESGEISYQDLHSDTTFLKEYRLIINTTPLGTFPKVDTHPDIPVEQLTPGHWYYDLVYNPAETYMMREVAKRGGKSMNGLEMLIGQAEAAWQIWNP